MKKDWWNLNCSEKLQGKWEKGPEAKKKGSYSTAKLWIGAAQATSN